MSAAVTLEVPDLLRAARRHASHVVAKSNPNGFDLADPLASCIVMPGLLQGLAGIAYQLRRVADPDIPSVLLWQ